MVNVILRKIKKKKKKKVVAAVQLAKFYRITNKFNLVLENLEN